MDVVFSIAHTDRGAAPGPHHRHRRAGRGAPQRGGAPRLPRGRQALTALLEVDGIHTAYGSSRVLFGISLDIKPGECVCLLGRNGVGKTTTMRSIMGLTPPSQGQRALQGQGHHRLAALPAGARAASATCRRTGASSPSSPCGRTSTSRARSADRAGRWTVETVCELFPKLGELRDRMGGVPVGRRAADADDRAHADGQPRAAAARRAVRRAGAGDRREPAGSGAAPEAARA